METLREFIETVQKDQCKIDEVSWKKLAAGAVVAGSLLAAAPQATYAQPSAHHYTHHGLPSRQYSEDDVINTIVGEAADQEYQGSKFLGMLAVADAIRNRSKHSYYRNNVLHGAFGRTAAHNKTEPKEVFDLARKAWNESSTRDITQGAYIWLSDSDIQKVESQQWFANVSPTIVTKGKSGQQTFFKDR